MDQGQTSRNRRARAIAITRTVEDVRRNAIVRVVIAAVALAAALQAAVSIHLVTKFLATH